MTVLRGPAIRHEQFVPIRHNKFAEDKLVNHEGPEQGALFEIEGPDEDGCVWICSAAGRDDWCQNLGPRDQVAQVLSQWLGSIVFPKKPDAR